MAEHLFLSLAGKLSSISDVGLPL